MRSSSCSPRTLASGDVARVDVCDHCGIVVLHVGPVSLRLEQGALESLASTLSGAQRALDARTSLDADEIVSPSLGAQWSSRGRA